MIFGIAAMLVEGGFMIFVAYKIGYERGWIEGHRKGTISKIREVRNWKRAYDRLWEEIRRSGKR